MSLRQGVILPTSPQNETLKSPPRLGLSDWTQRFYVNSVIGKILSTVSVSTGSVLGHLLFYMCIFDFYLALV